MIKKILLLIICTHFISCYEDPKGYMGLELIESSVKYEMKILSPADNETVEGYALVVTGVSGGAGELTFRSYINGSLDNSDKVIHSSFDNLFYLYINVDSIFNTPSSFKLKIEVEDEDNRVLSKEINLSTRKRNFSGIPYAITGYGINNYHSGDFDNNNTFWYNFQPFFVKIQNDRLTEIENPAFIRNYFCLCTDDTNQVWILGETQGNKTILAKYNGLQWYSYPVSDDYINSEEIEVDKNGAFWFFNEYPYKIYSYKNGTINTYDDSNIPVNLAPHFDGFHSMAIDNDNNKWFGTSNSLFKFDGSNWEVFDINLVEYYSQTSIFKIYPDNNNGLWLGTNWGLLFFKDGKLQFRVSTMVSYFLITGLGEDLNGNLWAVSASGGVVKVNLQTGSVVHYSIDQIKSYLNQDNIGNFISLNIDKTGNVWIVSSMNNGLDNNFIKIY